MGEEGQEVTAVIQDRFADPGQPTRWNAAFHAQSVSISGGLFSSAGRDVNHHTHFHVAPKPEKPKFDLLSELKAIDNFRRIQQDTLSKATPKTGEWIFEYEIFPVWKDPKSKLKTMWGSGIPGAGKTVLTSIVVNGISKWAKDQALSVCIGYIYIRYSDNASVMIRHYLEVLVKQTIEQHPNCLKLAENVYAEHIRFETRPTEEELLELLGSFTTVVALTIYFLDALDEAPLETQFDLVNKLSSLDVKLFITSRPMKPLQMHFPDVHCFPIAAHDHDIDLHITKEINRNFELRNILRDEGPGLREEIVTSVKRKCGGMFLHASLQMAALRECTSVHDVKETLSNFPSKIEDVYLDTWRRINDQSYSKRMLAQHSLLWVLHAMRSMTMDELRYAVAISSQTYNFDPSRLVSIDTIVSQCRGLLVVDEKTRLVRLVHYTAKDVMGHLILKISPRPHSLLTSTCIVRLIGHGFQDWNNDDSESLQNAFDDEPFLKYAHDEWPDHARKSFEDPSITLQLEQFIRGCHAFPVQYDGDVECDVMGPLHLVAFYDLPIAFAGFDPTSDQDPNAKAPNGETPLHVACIRKSLNTIKELLQLPHISVNKPNEYGATPLLHYLGAQVRRGAVVELLLAHPETDVNAVGGGYKRDPLLSALSAAALYAPLYVVEMLLAHPLVNVNGVDSKGRTPLIGSVEMGREASLKALLAHPQTNVNLKDNNGRTPLLWAVKKGHQAVLKALLAHPQVDVNSVDVRGQTPLLWAVKKGRKAVLKALLTHPQIDVNLADDEGWTPLLWAAKEGRETSLKSLLAHPQIDMNLVDKEGQTPLLWAVKGDRKAAFKALLARPQVDVNLADNEGRTPLFWALLKGHESSIDVLLTHPSVDTVLVDRGDKVGRAGLVHAAKHSASFRYLLLHPQVDMNFTDKFGRTPLLQAVFQCERDVVSLLLRHPRVNVNCADKEGRTPLMSAVKDSVTRDGIWSSFPKSKPLLQSVLSHPQVDVNAVDKQGETALIRAMRMGYVPSARLLLAHPNVNINLADKEGRAPLDWAKEQGKQEMVDLILAHPKFISDPDFHHFSSRPSTPSLLSTPSTLYTPSSLRSRGIPTGDVPQTSHALSYVLPSPSHHPWPQQLPGPSDSSHDSPSHAAAQTTCETPVDQVPHSVKVLFQLSPAAQQPGPHFLPTNTQSGCSLSSSPLKAPDHDLQRSHSQSRLQTSTPLSARAAEKRLGYDSDDYASARSFRRRLGFNMDAEGDCYQRNPQLWLWEATFGGPRPLLARDIVFQVKSRLPMQYLSSYRALLAHVRHEPSTSVPQPYRATVAPLPHGPPITNTGHGKLAKTDTGRAVAGLRATSETLNLFNIPTSIANKLGDDSEESKALGTMG